MLVVAGHVATPVHAAQICVWRGTAPLCAGECEQGETMATTRPESFDLFVPPGSKVVGLYGERCVTGSKALCCKEEFPEFVAWCSRYADDAVEQARKNLELNCGLHKENAARWTDNRDTHLNFCLGFDGAYAEPTQEALHRVAGLKNCKAVTKGPSSIGDVIKQGPAAEPAPPPPPADKPVTVKLNVEVYDKAGGENAGAVVIGELTAGTQGVFLVEPCNAEHWCHVKGNVPAGMGWAWSGPGYESLEF